MQYVIEDSTLIGIADAIRAKTDTQGEIPVVQMAAQIRNIAGGTAVSLQSKNESVELGETKTILPDPGYDGMSQVIVTAPSIRLQEKNATPRAEAFDVVPDTGYDGLSKVTIDAVPAEVPPVLEEITVTPSEEEQVIYPSEGYDYISVVTVLAAPGGVSVPSAMGVGF